MRQKSIPILMYHSIGSIKKGTGLRNLHTSPSLFFLQLLILKIFGYKGMSLTELLPYLEGKKHGKVFGITFDDGYKNNHYKALPILKRLGYTATCYIVADNIGGINYWDVERGHSEHKMMEKFEINNWISNGMEIGSHSMNHIRLTEVSPTKAKSEIFESKKILEESFKVSIHHFCYPYGSFNDIVVKNVKNAGYKSSVTVQRGKVFPTNNLFTLPRVLMTHRTYPISLLMKFFTTYEFKRNR